MRSPGFLQAMDAETKKGVCDDGEHRQGFCGVVEQAHGVEAELGGVQGDLSGAEGRA